MANLWSRGTARAALMGTRDTTMNPTPAARRLLGPLYSRFKKQAAAAPKKKSTARTFIHRRRPFHRGNPAPALIAGAASLFGGKLGKRLKSKAAAHAERVARADALAARALIGDAAAATELERLSREFATAEAKEYAAGKLAEVIHALEQSKKAEAAARRAESAAAGRAARGAAEATAARREGLAAGVLSSIADASLARGSLRPRAPRRRKKRKPRGRSFSF